MDHAATPLRERTPQTPRIEDDRTSTSVAGIKRAVLDHLMYSLGRIPEIATPHEYYLSLALAVRDRLQHHWVQTMESYFGCDMKVACYLSAEFLMGPHLENNLISLGIEAQTRQAMLEIGQDLDALVDQEEEPGLGNGGLGRLAACFLDSQATLMRPAVGYGIRYEFGIFDQEIVDGWQQEVTDKWLRYGNPWEIAKPSIIYDVGLGGHTESSVDSQGRLRVCWIPHHIVRGMAYDTPILGYRVGMCNTLRLWSAHACESFDFQAFNTGDYYEAVHDKVVSETLTKVLYPNDEPAAGKKLRLAQQYFFVSCSLQDMIRILQLMNEPLANFPDQFAVQLNDTHPSIAVAELMRLLVDEHEIPWEKAWSITERTFSYTNHTLLPEALETWPLPLFAELLPRHLEIIFEINRRFLDEVRRRFPGDEARIARLSLIDEAGEKRVRMAHLATVGSHTINGVAKLHTELLKESVLRDFAEIWPERFLNITNGVTPRRFMRVANPKLSELITQSIGDGWLADLDRLRELEPFAEDAAFRKAWRAVKRANKEELAAHVRAVTDVELDPSWIFDIQVKRIHEYKRQHLSVLNIITLYDRLKHDRSFTPPPRVFLFGGKAAPGYFLAKLIIRLISGVAEVINSDPDVNARLRVAFIPDFNVKKSHVIYPAADVSEQISLAGKEASGTGNMKFALNGALTVGTLDGANVEIREAVGRENFFLFGLTAQEVAQTKQEGIRPSHWIEQEPRIQRALELLDSGLFSRGDRQLFRPLTENLRWSDPFLVLADYAAYIACQEQVAAAWKDKERWTRMSILNTSRSGKFSSDRAIREYCDQIWKVPPSSACAR